MRTDEKSLNSGLPWGALNSALMRAAVPYRIHWSVIVCGTKPE